MTRSGVILPWPGPRLPDPEAALTELAKVQEYASRGYLKATLVAWHRYLDACGRGDLHAVAGEPDTGAPWSERFEALAHLARQTAIHRLSAHADIHWETAATAFTQAAFDEAGIAGDVLAHELAAGRKAAVNDSWCDLAASTARVAAHFALLARPDLAPRDTPPPPRLDAPG